MAGKTVEKMEVVVTVADTHIGRIAGVARQLAAAGLAGPQALGAAGIVTGRASPAGLAALRRVPGVTAVEAAGKVQLAPPDADIQ